MGHSGRGQRATFMRCRDLNKHHKDEECMACGEKEKTTEAAFLTSWTVI